jgi:hypothetical protein
MQPGRCATTTSLLFTFLLGALCYCIFTALHGLPPLTELRCQASQHRPVSGVESRHPLITTLNSFASSFHVPPGWPHSHHNAIGFEWLDIFHGRPCLPSVARARAQLVCPRTRVLRCEHRNAIPRAKHVQRCLPRATTCNDQKLIMPQSSGGRPGTKLTKTHKHTTGSEGRPNE